MARNPDPKYGRFILPLVVAGMVGATWAFVNALEPTDEPNSPTTVLTVATSTTTLPPVETTTTTTLAPAVAAYLADLQSLVAESEDLLERARELNNSWDNGSLTFQDTLDGLRTLADDTEDLAARIDQADVIPELEAAQIPMNDAAAALATAGNDLVDGLLDPDTSAGRIQAFADYQSATDSLRAGLEQVRQRAGIASALVTETEQATTTTTVAGDESGTTLNTTPVPED